MLNDKTKHELELKNFTFMQMYAVFVFMYLAF